MKLNKYFMLGLAGLAFAACSNDEEGIGTGGNDDAKTLVISISGISSNAGTRASAPVGSWSSDTQENAANNIQNISLFFTNASGNILYAYSDEKPVESSSDEKWSGLFGTNGVKFIGITGVEQVYAVANIPDYKAAGEDETGTAAGYIGKNISTLTTDINKQGMSIVKANAVVYAGGDKTITPLAKEPSTDMPEIQLGDGPKGGFYYTAEIKLVPIISRIQINKISIQTSGSIEFPDEKTDFNGTEIDAKKYKLTWSDFKPTLYGIYLNNFNATFNDLLGTVSDNKKNTTYINPENNGDYFIKGGQWLFGTEDYAEVASYNKYDKGSSEYQALLQYATSATGNYTDLVIDNTTTDDVTECIAFNVFVPFDLEKTSNDGTITPTAQAGFNPTIHFQFDKNIPEDFAPDYALTAGGKLQDTDNEYLANVSLKADYSMPQNPGAYLFANISKFYKESTTPGTASETELTMEPGKIYNMNVQISPANITIDLTNHNDYNVVVKITVAPFSEETIYPSFE